MKTIPSSAVAYRGSGGAVLLVAGDNLHDVVVRVGGQRVPPRVETKGGAARQPQVKGQVRGLLERD